MNSFIISLGIVLPMCLLMLTGKLLSHIKLLTPQVTGTLNKLVSSVFLPCMLFMNMYNSDLKTTFNPKVLIYAVGGVLVSVGIFMVVVPLLVKENGRRAAIIHALFRGNTAIFGVQLAQGIVGPSGNIDDLIVIMSVTIILYNVLGVVVLQVYCDHKGTVGSVVKGIVTNPMVIGGVLGLVLALTEIRLPEFVVSPIASLAAVTSPIAFLSLGASFNLKASAHNRKYIAWVTLVRLVVMPVIWLGIGVGLLGFRDGAVAALVAVFATPTAVNTFPLAAAAGADSDLAGELVVFTTAASVLTLFVIIFILKSMGVA